MIAGFLAQHYTTGRQRANDIAGYLASVGGETRGVPSRPGREAAPARPDLNPRDAAKKQQEEAAARAERKAKREAARRAAMEDRVDGRSGPDPRTKRPRQAGEAPTVSIDPDTVMISSQPVSVFHDRSLSRSERTKPPGMGPATVAARQPLAVPSGEAAAAPTTPTPPPAAAASSPATTGTTAATAPTIPPAQTTSPSGGAPPATAAAETEAASAQATASPVGAAPLRLSGERETAAAVGGAETPASDGENAQSAAAAVLQPFAAPLP